MGDRTVKLRVHIIVSIEQIELDTANVYLPNISMYLIVHIGYVYHNRVAILVQNALNRKRIEVLGVVFGNLLAIHTQTLSEVAEAIEETDCTEVNITVRCLLEVVTSQHTETTGVNLEHLVETIFHTEISYRRTIGIGLDVHVGRKLRIYILDFLHQLCIVHDFDLAIIA